MRSALLFLLIGLLFSCYGGIQKPQPPKDLIPMDQITEIVKDLVLIEGHITIAYKQIQQYHKIMSASSEAVFKKHKVSKDRYERSFAYYAADQDALTLIYSRILDELTLDKGHLE